MEPLLDSIGNNILDSDGEKILVSSIQEDIMESILISIKKLLGIGEDYVHFDADIIIATNTALAILFDLGVNSSKCLIINDSTTVWNQLTDDPVLQSLCKSYVHLKVKMLFDPPLSAAAIESNNRLISELESRIRDNADALKFQNGGNQ